MKKVLDKLNLRPALLPICSNVGALDYPETSSEISALLAKQMASPVEFIRQIEKLYEQGVRVFVEVGPRRAITGFVRNILDQRPHTAIHTNHHKRGDLEGALDALAAVLLQVACSSQGKIAAQIGVDDACSGTFRKPAFNNIGSCGVDAKARHRGAGRW